MNNLQALLILISITIITSMFDFYTSDIKECLENTKSWNTKYRIIFNILFHHFFANFSFIGWMFNNVIVLIIFCISPIIVAVHWNTNSNKCFITDITNKLCQFTKYKKFNEITTMLDFSDRSFSLLFIYRFVATMYGVYKLYNLL